MKKIYILSCALLAGSMSYGQTIPNGGMETWRNSTAGVVSAKPVHAPTNWYGADTLVIGIGQTLGTILGISPSVWKSQLFEESTVVHGGTRSAKLITVDQDTLGMFPGIMTNAKASVTISLAGLDNIKYSGGTPTNLRTRTVSAWVKYLPGKDSITGMFGGADTASMSIQALAFIGTKDSVVGSGFVRIAPNTAFTQVTANMVYRSDFDSNRYAVDTVRIVFASGGAGATSALDSSILYVDDVTMTGVTQTIINAVPTVTDGAEVVKVYPNPAKGILYLNGPANTKLNYTLYAVDGRQVANKSVDGTTSLAIGDLAAGTYLYAIADENGIIVQRGKVEVSK